MLMKIQKHQELHV